MGMSRREIMATRLGEMMEMIDCHAIAHGAEVKSRAVPMSFDEAIRMR